MQSANLGNKQPKAYGFGCLIVSSLFLYRVLGIVRDAVIAWKFGATSESDAYRLALQGPDLLFFFFAGGAVSASFAPVFAEYLNTKRESEAWKVFSVVATVFSLVVGLLVVCGWLFSVPIAHALAPGKPVGDLPLIASITRIFLPAEYALLIGSLLFGLHYARQRLVLPGLSTNLANLGIILGAASLSGIAALAWGGFAGILLGNLLVPAVGMKSLGIRFSPSLDLRLAGVRSVLSGLLPQAFILGPLALHWVVLQAVASNFSAGSNSLLEYSTVIVVAPVALFGQSLAQGIFTALGQSHASGHQDQFAKQLGGGIRTILYLTLPISILAALLAPQIMVAVFEHGRFTHPDALAGSELFRYLSLGIWAWCLQPLLMRALLAAGKQRVIVLSGASSLVILIAMVFVFRPLALNGLGMAASSTGLISTTLLLAVQEKIDWAGVGATLAKAAIASGVAALLVEGALVLTNDYHGPWLALELVFLALGGAWTYYGLARLFKMPEAAYVDRALAKTETSDKK